MNVRIMGISLLFVFAAYGCVDNFQLDEKSSEAAYESSNQIYGNVITALVSTGLSARIYAQQGSCRVGNYGYLPLPQISYHPLADGQKGPEAIRHMFEDNPDVTVSEYGGIVRIRIGKVSDGLLKTSIPELTFTQHAQYYPRLPDGSVDTIVNAPEVRRSARGLRLSEVWGVVDELVPGHDETDPHLPPALDNVTFDQALDSVATTFDGVVSYTECRKSNGYGFFDVGFIYIR